jgi:hypothetical protein
MLEIPLKNCVSCLAGVQICLRNVHVKRGIFLLVPEVVEILGGFVQLLEAARQRAVQEINKPARSNRYIPTAGDYLHSVMTFLIATRMLSFL